MEEIQGESQGSQEISDHVTLRSMIEGDVTVLNGGVLNLYGMVTGSVVVEHGGTVLLHGTVGHDVTNRGGRLEVYGTVIGRLVDEAGTTFVDPEAAVQNRR